MDNEKYDFLSSAKIAHLLRLRNALVYDNFDNKKLKYSGINYKELPIQRSFFSKLKKSDNRILSYIYNYLINDNKLLNVSSLDFGNDNNSFKIKSVDFENSEIIEEVISLSEDNSSPIKSERIIKKDKGNDKVSVKKEIVYSNPIAIELIKLYSDKKIVGKDSLDSTDGLLYNNLWYRTINDIGVVTTISKEDGKIQRRGISSCDIATVNLSDTFDIKEEDIDISMEYLNRCLELNSNKKNTSVEQFSFVNNLLSYYNVLKNNRLNNKMSQTDEELFENYNEEDIELREFIDSLDLSFEPRDDGLIK